MCRIGVITGFWSTNIGNSFFQLGAEFVIRSAVPNAKVFFVADQPGYWNPRIGNPPGALCAAETFDFEYLILSGPVFRPEYSKIMAPTLRRLNEKGVKLILLSAGMMDYSASACERYRRWVEESPLYAITTRDEQTYECLAGSCERIYNGIDIAFFIRDFHANTLKCPHPFIVLNFDKSPEPKVYLGKDRKNIKHYSFQLSGEDWLVEFPAFRRWLSGQHWAMSYLDSFWPVKLPERAAGYRIIRTEHRFNPTFIRKTFRGPSSFASDVPYTYLDLYANTSLTLSDRVHACVATLAFGNPAMLFSSTPRSGLFDRVGLGSIKEKPMRADLKRIDDEKRNLLSFVSSIFRTGSFC